MYYKVINNKKEEWILLIHPICSNMSIFKKEINDLGKKYNIILVDLPGHGNSKEYCTFTFNSVVEELINILNNLSINKIDVWGISLGAIVALKLVIMAKEKINTIIFEDPAFGLGNRFLLNMFGLFNRIKIVIPSKIYLHLFIHLIVYGKNKKRIKKIFFDSLKQVDRKAISMWLKFMYDEYKKDIKYELEKIDKSKIYIIGGKDFIFKPYVLKNIKEDSKSKIIILDKRSHICHLEEKIDTALESKKIFVKKTDYEI